MLKKIYERSPSALQDIFLTLQAAKYRKHRLGGNYKSILNLLMETQHYSNDELLDWQINQFKKVFGEAYLYTNYYKNIFDKGGVKLQDIKDFSFLKDLPSLTKEQLRATPDEFVNKKRKIVYTSRTGGTTGAPLVTPYDAESLQWASAFLTRFFHQAGVKYGSQNLHMTGQQVVPLTEKKKFWRHDFLGDSLYLSLHHLNYDSFPAYWEKVNAFRPAYIFGYTSFIYDFARYVNEFNLSGQLKLKGVFPSSEKLTPQLSEEIGKAFNCTIFDHYGATEGIPLITQCKEGRYHVVPESGIIEFLTSEGKNAMPGEPAEMYMTSLRQFSRPILRYKIGDTAIYTNKKCSCGLNWTVIEELTGRLSEWVTLENGKRISQFSHQVFKLATKGIISSQIIQHSYNEFEIKIVRNANYAIEDEAFIVNRIHELIGKNIQIRFNYLAEIPKTAGGKRPSLISKVS